MLPKMKVIISFLYIKSIICFSYFFILQANAETKIIAKNGDTLLKLSKQYRIPLKELMHKNNFNDANKIVEGETIIIPQRNNNEEIFIYKVKDGDTLYKISRDFNINIKDIVSINNLDNISNLKLNQRIKIPYRSENQKQNIELNSRKVFYHQTSKYQEISEIAKIHNVTEEQIISSNKLNNPTKVNPNTKLKIRQNKTLEWIKYGSLIINWSKWVYLDGNYITEAKNKKNKFFFIAISCDKRTLNNTLKNSYWTSWYFPSNDFEFKLLNKLCDNNYQI